MIYRNFAIFLSALVVSGIAQAEVKWQEKKNIKNLGTTIALAVNKSGDVFQLLNQKTKGGYKVYRNNQLIGGGLVEIYGGKSIWGINDQRNLFRYDKAKRRWTSYSEKANAIGVNLNDKVWRLKVGDLCKVDKSIAQHRCPSRGVSLARYDGSARNKAGNVNTVWTTVKGQTQILHQYKKSFGWMQVYSDADGVPWIISRDGKVQKWDGRFFRQKADNTKALAFAPNGDIWRLARPSGGGGRGGLQASDIFVSRDGGGKWAKIPKIKATHIAVDDDGQSHSYKVIAVKAGRGAKLYVSTQSHGK